MGGFLRRLKTTPFGRRKKVCGKNKRNPSGSAPDDAHIWVGDTFLLAYHGPKVLGTLPVTEKVVAAQLHTARCHTSRPQVAWLLALYTVHTAVPPGLTAVFAPEHDHSVLAWPGLAF